MVYVYLAGAWSWLNRATAARKRLTFRECAKVLGHAGEHIPSLVREVPPTYTGLERLRLARPDPERDRRRAAYRVLERERARRALDAWFQEVNEAGEWQYPGDLLKLMADYGELVLHHKGNYGITASSCYGDGHDRDHEDMQGVPKG